MEDTELSMLVCHLIQQQHPAWNGRLVMRVLWILPQLFLLFQMISLFQTVMEKTVWVHFYNMSIQILTVYISYKSLSLILTNKTFSSQQNELQHCIL